jgi:hypothetical protein
MQRNEPRSRYSDLGNSILLAYAGVKQSAEYVSMIPMTQLAREPILIRMNAGHLASKEVFDVILSLVRPSHHLAVPQGYLGETLDNFLSQLNTDNAKMTLVAAQAYVQGLKNVIPGESNQEKKTWFRAVEFAKRGLLVNRSSYEGAITAIVPTPKNSEGNSALADSIYTDFIWPTGSYVARTDPIFARALTAAVKK